MSRSHVSVHARSLRADQEQVPDEESRCAAPEESRSLSGPEMTAHEVCGFLNLM